MMKKIAVLYMRMSTDMQEHSLASQERMLREYAERNGYIIIEKYIDEGISGQHASKRPAFMKMIDDSEHGEFQFVLIYDSSRFARNLVESLTYKKMLMDNGVRLLSITEPNVDDDEMQLYFDAFSGASNEIYVRKLSKNVTRGHVDKCIRGEIAGTPSFGYYKDKYHDTYQIQEEEAEVLRYMYDSMLNGETYQSIAGVLLDKGVKSRRGHIIDTRQVKRMLKNPAYKGFLRRTIGGQSFFKKCDLEPIVSEEVFDKVQEIIAERESRYKKNEKPAEFRKHWLSGLLVCPYCGAGYSYNTRKPPQHDAFRCGNATRGVCKKGSSILVDVVENMMFDKLSEVYSGPLAPYVKNITVVTPKSQIDYDKEIRTLEGQLKRAKQAYLAEIDTMEEYAQNKRRITAAIKVLKQSQKKAQEESSLNEPQFKVKLLNVITVLKSDCPMSEKITVARTVIEKIMIDPRNKTMDIYFYA